MLWLIKIFAKIVLSRLPLPYGFWRFMGVFKLGKMDSLDYSIKIFKLHALRAYPDGLPHGTTILELGPGDSFSSAVIGRAMGADKIYAVDAGSYALQDVGFYKKLAALATTKIGGDCNLHNAHSFVDVLELCRAEYCTNGLESLRSLPSDSIDFIWSHSVLEHVRKNELEQFLVETRRILKRGGFASHNIDYKDHLGGQLNNLRFAESLWESPVFANSGFYTNRVPACDMHGLFRKVGFNIKTEGFGRWNVLPTPKSALHAEFLKYEDHDLLVCTSHVLLEK